MGEWSKLMTNCLLLSFFFLCDEERAKPLSKTEKITPRSCPPWTRLYQYASSQLSTANCLALKMSCSLCQSARNQDKLQLPSPQTNSPEYRWQKPYSRTATKKDKPSLASSHYHHKLVRSSRGSEWNSKKKKGS